MTGRLHFMMGNLSRVDARLSTQDSRPKCDWFCKNQEFLLRANRLPTYGPLYFPMFYAVMRAWNIAFPRVLEATTEEDVDTLMEEHMDL